ncbi:hypothetical protein BDM02DRAFT_3192871 [Thelephora ganbajun]|uniref:Uncharacterized protein n=1 Tax=Thelephora ganbajun TaxID=370292 RepID=A0ACB6YZS5_THEGA|nr:hypothetical protein BDM02DRAFT_3192871 [Thelephora ganbajun]
MEVSAPVVKPVVHKSAWVGPFIDVLLSSLRGKKRRQRERLQRALEAKALQRSGVPSSSVVLDESLSSGGSPSEAATTSFPEQD